jgi:rhodanese-related sulfurtransferase
MPMPILVRRRWLIGLAAIAALGGAIMIAGGPLRGAGWPDPGNPATSLADVEAAVSRQYPVPEVTGAAFEGLQTQGDVVIFDVREASEYQQSHIERAVRVEPSLSSDEFVSRYASAMKGRSVVLYCSVGVRSGQLLDRALPLLKRAGVAAAYNLRGGIFRWFADGGRVVAHSGPARSVHPYDDAWGKLLTRTIAAGAHDGRL